MGRTPSPQPQSIQQPNYQQQIVVPYPAYKAMNSGSSSSNNLISANSTPVINNLSQSLSTGTNSNYPSKFFRSLNIYTLFFIFLLLFTIIG